jgi:hypothetical protein
MSSVLNDLTYIVIKYKFDYKINDGILEIAPTYDQINIWSTSKFKANCKSCGDEIQSYFDKCIGNMFNRSM